MSFLKALFSPKFQDESYIEHWIEKLARRDDPCEYLREVKFSSVADLMADRRAQVLSPGDPFPNESVLYRLPLRGRNYEVRATRSMDRGGVLLTSKLI